MRRLARWLFTLCSAVSLLLCVAVCVSWARGRRGADEAEWKYSRWLADGGVASNEVDVTLQRRIVVGVQWARVPPRSAATDHLYYYRGMADRSGGRPRLWLRHRRYLAGPDNDAYSPEDFESPGGYAGWGPVRWYVLDESRPGIGFTARGVHLGVSHWL